VSIIIAIARSWCVTEEGGSLTIGVMYDKELDYIKFNAGRWYGKIRYPYLSTNWKQHYKKSIFLLKNIINYLILTRL
jgi:hypothetical protein